MDFGTAVCVSPANFAVRFSSWRFLMKDKLVFSIIDAGDGFGPLNVALLPLCVKVAQEAGFRGWLSWSCVRVS